MQKYSLDINIFTSIIDLVLKKCMTIIFDQIINNIIVFNSIIVRYSKFSLSKGNLGKYTKTTLTIILIYNNKHILYIQKQNYELPIKNNE